MISTIFFLGLNAQEQILFQVIQTILDYSFNVLLIYLIFSKIAQKKYSLRTVLFTGLIVEAVHVASFLSWYFLVLYAMGGFIIIIIFSFLAPYFVFYVQFSSNSNPDDESEENSETEESKFKKKGKKQNNQEIGLSIKKTILSYISTVPPALVVSSLLTCGLLNLLGIQNFFILT